MTPRANPEKATARTGEPDLAAVPSAPREAAFFDLDKTLLPGAALFPLAREMYRQHVLTNRDIARIATDQILYRLSGKEDKNRMRRAREASLAAVKGRAQAEVAAMGRLVVERELVPRF